MIIGITGGSGSGKTTLLQLIARQGGVVFDCDAIYHELLKSDPSLLASVSRRFPGTVTNGVLNRKKLGEIVFSQEQALLDLNEITHAAVKNRVMQLLESKPSLAAIDAIGLFEGALDSICDVTVAIIAPAQVRIARIMARDGISEEYAKQRIAAQHSDDWFAAHCDAVLENTGTEEEFTAKCLAFLDKLGIIKEKAKGE
ncbi:MAG: dephospho-CoA kinase [Ruminococcaceae bacterium]|nr:dephospho-CoA kinase [Oscillospiraceae bacterium]